MSTKYGNIRDAGNMEVDTDLVSLSQEVLLDNFTKLAILSMVAAYRKKVELCVDAKFDNDINIDQLSNFLSYLISHPAGPMQYNMKIRPYPVSPQHKPQASGKFDYETVLSFSGGLDSTAGLLCDLDRGKKVLPLWIDFGQPNDLEESASVRKILGDLKINLEKIKVNLGEEVKNGYADWKHLVPGRNFLFVALANSLFKTSPLNHGEIQLCSNSEEVAKWKYRDKGPYFFRQCSKYFSQDTKKDIIVESPIGDYSKSEILYWWRTHWEEKYQISPYDTATCYYDNKCGRCRACFRRSICLLSAGYEIDPDIQVHPLTDPEGFIEETWIPEVTSGKRPRTQKLDFVIALERAREVLPRKLNAYYESIPWQTKKAADNRKLEIAAVDMSPKK